MFNSENARRFTRAPFCTTLEMWIAREPTPVEASNISAGGAFLAMTGPARPGSYVTLRFPITAGKRLTCFCRVLRREESVGVAVEFLDLLPSQRKALNAYVENNAAPTSA
ncbi:MAG: PilZ domain-containing protein [Deltaproteobacteria bacterium]|nr:PilZ domain-containing protein [Deltaproteobacteria bacterium]